MEKETNELKDKLDKEIAERKVSADIIRRNRKCSALDLDDAISSTCERRGCYFTYFGNLFDDPHLRLTETGSRQPSRRMPAKGRMK